MWERCRSMCLNPEKGHGQYQRTPHWDIIQVLNLTTWFESTNIVRSPKVMFDKYWHKTEGNCYDRAGATH